MRSITGIASNPFRQFSLRFAVCIAGVAFAPFAAQAVTFNWTGGTSIAWPTGTNWNSCSTSCPAPGLASGATDAVTINSATHEPTINNIPVFLDGAGASLTVNTGATLTLGGIGGTGIGTLNMGANSITLNGTLATLTAARSIINLGGGSIAGTGSITGTTAVAINGFGTVSVPVAPPSTIWTASGGALTLTGGNTYRGQFTANTGGSFNFGTGTGAGQGVTLTGTTPTTGITTTGTGGTFNLNGATINNATLTSTNAQWNVLGDSTLSGTITNSNSRFNTFNIGGTTNGAHTLNLSAATFSSNFNATIAAFIIGAGGTLNNSSGASSLNNGGFVNMQGGSITNTGGGLFTINSPINVTGGTSSAPTTLGGGAGGITLNNILTITKNGYVDLGQNLILLSLFGDSTSSCTTPTTCSNYGTLNLDGFNASLNGMLLAPGFYINPNGTVVDVITGAPAVTPLPSTWTMMILGLCGIGFMAYRRKTKPALMAA
jgi:hypothetical protein